ncbi:MAG TPA: gliding motility-associated C-terminal domain-containing protein, partial [Cytophagaceae bacterium]
TVYTVTATDINGCTGVDSVRVNVVPLPVANAGADTSICYGDNIMLSATGGGTYNWLPVTGLSDPTIANPIASPVTTTTYTVMVTNAWGCNHSDEVVITVNPLPTANAGYDTTICMNESITLSASGGVSYSWSPAGTLSDATVPNPIATPGTSTTYTVTVTDSNGCIATDNITITVNPIPVANAGTDVTICEGTNTKLNGTGGVTYFWSPGSSLSDSTISSPLANPLVSTTYILTVFDNAGCYNSDSVTVFVNPKPTGTVTTSKDSICRGEAVTLTASFNAPSIPAIHAYSFDGGSIYHSSNTFNIASVNSDTTIYVVLMDNNACISDSIPLTITLKTVSGTSTQIQPATCFGAADGIAQLTLDSSYTGFTFSINGGPQQASGTFTNLTAGNYIITATDADNCPYDFPVTITQPDSMVLSVVSSKNITCFNANNGEVELNVTGGNPGYTFTLTNLGISQTDSLFTNLPADTLLFIAKDSKGCPEASVTVILTQPSGINTAAIKIDSIAHLPCYAANTGYIKLDTSSITGGTKPYTYILGTETKSFPEFDNLSGGNWKTILIVDANNCMYNYNFKLNEPLPISFKETVTDATCQNADGSITLTVTSGGVPPFLYSKDGGNNFSPTPTFNNLTAGVYSIAIKDATGCGSIRNVIVGVKPGPEATVKIKNVSCYGLSDGMIEIDSISGGNPFIDPLTGQPYYKYSLNFNNSLSKNYQTENTFSGLNEGPYTLYIQDQDCEYVHLELYGRTKLFSGLQKVDSVLTDSVFTTYPLNDSILSASVITNRWMTSTVKVSPYLPDLSAIDSLTSDSIYLPYIYIRQPDSISAEALSIESDRYLAVGGAQIFNLKGGTPPYFYSTDTTAGYTPKTSDTITVGGFAKGYQTVYIKDINNCPYSIMVKVTVPFFMPNLFTPNGDDINDKFEIIAMPKNSELRVFNKWGSRVYFNKNYDNSWDGDGLPDGVYYVELLIPGGKLIKQWVEIIR